MGELEAKLEHVRRARALTDASPVDAFAFDYSTYALNEQYLHIRTTLLTVLAFALAAAAVVMLPLIVHPFTELLVLCIIVVTEVELYAPPPLPPIAATQCPLFEGCTNLSLVVAPSPCMCHSRGFQAHLWSTCLE